MAEKWVAIEHQQLGAVHYVKTEEGRHVGYAFSAEYARVAATAPEAIRCLERMTRLFTEGGEFKRGNSVDRASDAIHEAKKIIAKAKGEINDDND